MSQSLSSSSASRSSVLVSDALDAIADTRVARGIETEPMTRTPTQRAHSILALSTSLLIDRMFVHTDFLRTLARRAHVEVWAASAANPAFASQWAEQPALVS